MVLPTSTAVFRLISSRKLKTKEPMNMAKVSSGYCDWCEQKYKRRSPGITAALVALYFKTQRPTGQWPAAPTATKSHTGASVAGSGAG